MLTTTKDRAQILYKDWGPKYAQHVLSHHGSPPNSEDGETQMLIYVGQGYRVIAREDRGHRDHYAFDMAAVERQPAFQQGSAS